ncbi:MAG: aminodeoxychorismate synthase component I [Gammaproteobacteria bacterium]|nr:aminodeoxychorismate synthase component I [Gammaproteobacteria bacterium]
MLNVPYSGLLFSEPCDEIICWDAAALSQSLARLDSLRRDGYYLAGCLSYEAGYVLRGLPHLLMSPNFPLLHFFAFKAPEKRSAAEINAFLGQENARPQDVALNITASDYATAFSRVKQHIVAGDTYQVNLTAKYTFNVKGSSLGLYNSLRARQKVAYSAWFKMPEYEILSLSPELFFSKIKHKIYTKPMKGTMPRASDLTQDKANQHFLLTDLKSRAENTMIVDLLRNDLSAISKPGSVHVQKLLEVESYETVHQMTSSIESEVAVDLSFSAIINALFPCGSITGAPKRRTMEIIHEMEPAPRGIYTGAMGYITPQNDMCFNVPIRTVLCRGSQGELGVGGGIVHDSTLQSEFEELKLKAQFLTRLSACDLA